MLMISSPETGELYYKAKTRLALGGFRLRKWLTNCGELREKIEQRELRDEINVNKQIESVDESYAKATLGAMEGAKNEKVLSQAWNCEMDLLIFELSKIVERADNLPVTKRNVLKDPEGTCRYVRPLRSSEPCPCQHESFISRVVYEKGRLGRGVHR